MASLRHILVVAVVVCIYLQHTSARVSMLDSCPDHCYCFVVSRDVPPPTALLTRYMQANDWLDGREAIACWGRGGIPQPIPLDVTYLILIGTQKPKRRSLNNHDPSSQARPHRGRMISGNAQAILLPGSARRRNIRVVPQDAFRGLTEVIQIDLLGNKIVELRPSSFQGVSNLARLNLNKNRLKSLELGLLHDSFALQELRVADNFLRSLPDGLFQNNQRIETLDLSENILQTLPEYIFQPLGNLKYLNLSYNRVSEKSRLIFTGLSQLSELYLQRNKFMRLDALLLLSNTRLTKLDMSHNRLKTIEEDAFQNQHELQVLDLSGNSLTTLIERALRGTVALRTLDLSFNSITGIFPGAFSGSANLTKLYMMNNRLANITRNTFGNISALTHLSLANNNISGIAPDAMTGLESLEFLDLSGNLLRQLAARSFQGLNSLKDLNLASNRISIIEPEAFRTTSLSFMSQLTWLNLHGNQLSELQRGAFRGASSLRVLTVSRNQIRRVVPETFSGFNRLHRLMMSDNRLEELPDGVFRLLRTIEMLDLSNNSLRVISKAAFRGLNGLNNLNLADNFLTNEPLTWLGNLQSIQTLNLNDNQFTQLSSKNFEVAINLRYLYMSNNNVTDLVIASDSRLFLYNLTLANNLLTDLNNFPPHILPGKALDISNNPWSCSCRLVSMFSDMALRDGIRFDKEEQMECRSPLNLKGLKITSLIRSGVKCSGQSLLATAIPTPVTSAHVSTNQTPQVLKNDMTSDSTFRWSWVVVLWDSVTDTPVCNGALVSPSFIVTSYQCLKRFTDITSSLRLVSQCAQPLEGNCLDSAWTAPSNMEVKFSRGQRTMREFLPVAETYRVLRIHKVSTETTSRDASPIILQLSYPIDTAGPASAIELLDDDPRTNTLQTKRVMASGWWIDRASAPEVVGRQKRRHYRVLSSPCGSRNDVTQPFLCGQLEQDLGEYKHWDSLGAPVSIRKHNVWKLVGFLAKNENHIGFISDVRPYRDTIMQIIADRTVVHPVTHPY